MKLIDARTRDGSRHYPRLPQTVACHALRDHALRPPQAKVINFVGEGAAGAWLDFLFRGHRFLICRCNRQYHFFVHDPHCCDLIVYQVAQHFCQLLTHSTMQGKPDWRSG